jgi:hypothetical protein
LAEYKVRLCLFLKENLNKKPREFTTRRGRGRDREASEIAS